MINSMIESISIALNAEFGDRSKVHREAKKQGLTEPCFFIQCLNPVEELFLGKRYSRKNQFCIQYFPEDKLHGEQECHAAAGRLFSCLECLGVGGSLVRGTKMRYEMADGILHFFVNYDLFVYKAGDFVPVMEEVSADTSVKG